MSGDRSWMYRSVADDGLGVTDEFKKGVRDFLAFAFSKPSHTSDNKIRCPCKRCRNLKYKWDMPKGIVRPSARRGLSSSQSAPPLGGNATETSPNEHAGITSSTGEASTPSPSSSSCKKTRGPNMPTQNKSKKMKHMEIMDSCFKHPEISRQAMIIVKAHYTEAWPSWKAIPKDERESMWTHLKQKYPLKDNVDEQEAKAIWEAGIKHSIRQVMRNARARAKQQKGTSNLSEVRDTCPEWINNMLWSRLVDYWTSPEWQHKSEVNKRNRLGITGRPMVHVGGSIPFELCKAREEERLGWGISRIELYDITHMRDGQYVDDRAKDVSEKYKAIVSEKHGHETSSQPSFDAEAWIQASGGPKKDRLLGFSATVDPYKALGTFCSSSSSRCSSRSTETSKIQMLELQLKAEREERMMLQTKMNSLESAMSKFLSSQGLDISQYLPTLNASSCSSGEQGARASASHPIGNIDGEDTDDSNESEDADDLE